MVIINSRMKIILFLIILTIYINALSCFSTYNQTMTIQMNNSELEIFHINYDKNNDTSCKEWIPSLFIPMLLSIDPLNNREDALENCEAIIPTISLTRNNKIKVFNS